MANTKPVHEIRLGTIRAAIWEHIVVGKGSRFNVTVNRGYLSNGQWNNTQSFGRDDLLILAKALDQAHTWIHEQKKQQAA